MIVDRGESQSVMLCSGRRGGSEQGRVRKCYAVFKKVW